MSKTIVICSNAYPPNFIGGAELIAHYQAKIMKERGNNVIIFAGDKTNAYPRYSMRQDDYEGLPTFRIALRQLDYSPESINFYHPTIEIHFQNLLNAFSPDVVHMHNITGLSVGMIHAAKSLGIKTVVTLHDHWGFCFKNTLIKKQNEICVDYNRCAECMPFVHDGTERGIPIRMRMDLMAFQLSEVDTFISPSLYLAEVYVRAGIPVGKMKQIWYGIDVARLSAVVKKKNSGKVRFTFIGYFGSHKGIAVLLKALTKIAFLDHISLNLVGSGPLDEHVRQQVGLLKLGTVVKLWGKVDHTRIEEVFAETDVLVLPSIWPENQPVTITEAMATRTPVIASAIGGIPELVISGQNGYTFRTGSAEDLAGKMSEFVSRPERIEVFGENGFRMIKDKTFERQVDKVFTVYE